jgi:hypothetical protein
LRLAGRCARLCAELSADSACGAAEARECVLTGVAGDAKAQAAAIATKIVM